MGGARTHARTHTRTFVQSGYVRRVGFGCTHNRYSTCSFNPSENEAVVAEVLRQCRGSVELVDSSHMFPALKRAPGMSTWKVAARSTEIAWLDSIADVAEKHTNRCVAGAGVSRPTEWSSGCDCVRLFGGHAGVAHFRLVSVKRAWSELLARMLCTHVVSAQLPASR